MTGQEFVQLVEILRWPLVVLVIGWLATRKPSAK